MESGEFFVGMNELGQASVPGLFLLVECHRYCIFCSCAVTRSFSACLLIALMAAARICYTIIMVLCARGCDAVVSEHLRVIG